MNKEEKEEMKRLIRTHPSLSPSAKLLGAVLVDISNDEGVCVITDESLAQEMGVFGGTIVRLIFPQEPRG
jgi:hypothetical protein